MNDWEEWATEDVDSAVTTIHEMGLKAFAKSRDNALTATTANHLHIYESGIDVAYTYNVENAVEARKITNTKNSVIPP